MEFSGCPPDQVREVTQRDAGTGFVPEPYDSFMCSHLRYYGYFRGEPCPRGLVPFCPLQLLGLQPCSPQGQKNAMSLGDPSEQHPTKASSTRSVHTSCPRHPRQEPSFPRHGASIPSAQCREELQALFGCPSPWGPLPAPRWPVECEVIKETVEHIEWVPPEPEPFCQPMGPELAPAALSEEQGTVVYHLSPAPRGSCFTRARVGGAPGPLSSPAAPLEGPHDTTLLFESRFESGNLQEAIKVGPYEYLLRLRPDLYTTKHTQWFYFRVQNTRRGPLYRFTIANMAKPKSLYGQGLRPLLYSQRDAQTRGIGWRRVGDHVCYRRGGDGREPAPSCLSWSSRFPHDADTCFFAHSYPYTYSDLRRYLRALAADPGRRRYCAVRALCRSLAGNPIYLLTVTHPAAAPTRPAVVLSARAHPGESGGSWAMQGFLDFLLSAHPDAQLLRRLFVFKVVPMLNPDGVVVGNSRCSLAGGDPNRAYGTALRGSFPGVWHLRTMVERVLAEREVVLYCDFHGHSRKNNVFMYGCEGGSGARLCQRLFPLMLSKNAPDKFSFPSCKFKVQKSKAGTGRVVMWHLGITNSYTMEVAFSGSTMGGRSSHFTVQDLKSLGYHLCDTLLDFCDPDPAKLQQCLSEVETLLWQQLGREPGSGGGWSDVPTSELESSTSGSDSSVSDGPPAHPHCPEQLVEPQRRKRLQRRRARTALHRAGSSYRHRASIPCHSGPTAAVVPQGPVPTVPPPPRFPWRCGEALPPPRDRQPSAGAPEVPWVGRKRKRRRRCPSGP
ncbi:cytosolic carboxypeptidase 2 [Dryobates pubescens]|uniref:cytosolic carboxypeptidase 2 n=1 Tax=Dryobates pubescens TaxID=118200 RepID=UPI0023B8E631|nr:cytosolic carboxypeptidase 2 [Dryobates pubescens]